MANKRLDPTSPTVLMPPVSVPLSLLKALRRKAKEKRQTPPQAVREAIKRYISDEQVEQRQEQQTA